jgi:hypothetical protein
MSAKLSDNIVDKNIENKEPHHKFSLSNLIDHIQLKNLESYYQKEESTFKKRIDKLNLKFYLETEKYLNNTEDEGKCQNQLFIILFQQISLYIEEIERLNKSIQEKNELEISSKQSKFEDFKYKEREKLMNGQAIKKLKVTIKQQDKKISEFYTNEEKLKKEIESLKRQLNFHNEKLQFEMTMKKAEEMKSKKILKADSSFNTKTNSKEKLKKDEFNKSDSKNSKIKKKIRNLSDNNPGSSNIPSNIITNQSLVKSNNRYELSKNKETVEYNNININLNLNLKNSNNANINVGSISKTIFYIQN